MIKNAIAYVYQRVPVVSTRKEDEGVTLYEYIPFDTISGFEFNEFGKKKFFADNDTEFPYIEDIIDINEQYVYAFPYYTDGKKKSKMEELRDELYESLCDASDYKLIQLYSESDDQLITLATKNDCTFANINPSSFKGFDDMLNATYKPISSNGRSLNIGKIEESTIETNEKGTEEKIEIKIMSTKDMFSHITKSVICQDEPIKRIVTGFAKNQRIIKALEENPEAREQLINAKQSFFVCGPTGVGKTAIFRSLAEIVNVPIVFEDSTQYTMEGYVGQSPVSIIRNLISAADGNIDLAQRGIIVMDEFDKKASSKDVSPAMTTEVQSSFLTMMQGHKYSIESKSSPLPILFDTSSVTFAFLGAYSGIEEYIKKKSNIGFGADVSKKSNDINYNELFSAENLIKYGMQPEIIGRSNVIPLKGLNLDDLIKIIIESDKSPINTNKLLYALIGINLIIEKDAIEALARKSSSYDKSGARGIKKAVEDILVPAEFEIFSDSSPKEVIITEESIDDPKKLVLRY